MDEEKKVVNLMDEKIKRNHAAATRMHEDGELFKFEPFEFIDDDDTPNGIGLIEGDKPVSLLLDIKTLSGICMDVDTARRLAKELEGVCNEFEHEMKGQLPP